MALRPVFVTDDQFYVKVISIEFRFFNGFSRTQKQRCIDSLHEAFREDYPEARVLEVSRYSKDELGIALSAFNLLISLGDGTKVPLETAFQAGKIFESGGPYKELLHVSPKIAKTDPRLKESGRVTGFEFEGRAFPTEPKTLFYTWLYLHALDENKELADQICEYDAFTDIVFNPEKSINCQAYACAVYATLRRKGEVRNALENIDFLTRILGGNVSRTKVATKTAQGKIIPKKTENDIASQKDKVLSFRENDIIIHPKYGEGKIKSIERGTTESYITVDFGNLEKTLAGSWISANCKHAD